MGRADTLNCGKATERIDNWPDLIPKNKMFTIPQRHISTARGLFEGSHGGGYVYLTPCICTEPCFLQGYLLAGPITFTVPYSRSTILFG